MDSNPTTRSSSAPRRLVGALALAALASPVGAQLTDLQPGRNFPTAATAFGGGRTGGLDLADADHDGDLDVAAANGMSGTGQLNGLYINQGGAQAGAVGTFIDESVTRFAGLPADKSRDLEFVDYDGDGDLDLFFTNEGSTSSGGGVCRAYTNQGGMQLGQVAFYAEHTDAFWGTLVAVPLAQQVFGGDQGPFRDFSQDCSFGDFDLDGDPDLFHSSWGPSINGTYESRVFLNDGAGTFHELWPWADAAADIKLHTNDVDLVDIDSDFDLDVFASSRDSQARVYRNDLDVASMSWPGDPFTDVTQTALLDPGAALVGTNNYEAELADIDGDGDFDAWMNNYDGFKDRLLVNNGAGRFSKVNSLIVNDPNMDEEELDFLDYDGDGDLDAFAANFSGTNYLYQNSLNDGWPGHGAGLMHRTGAPGGQAPWFETPASGNGGTSDAGESGDVDNDGDDDLLIGNDNNATNRLWINVLGVPDTHAPTIHLLTDQPDKADGSDTPIRVQLRDNAPERTVRLYGVDLVYTVSGGLPARVPMRSQRGYQFQATIPGGVSGVVDWHVEGRDRAGNAFVSAPRSYVQTSSGVTLIEPVGSGTTGVAGYPDLLAFGDLTGGSVASLSLRDGPASATALLFLSVASTPLPFKGGWLHTLPIGAAIPLLTDAAGSVWVDLPWPAGLPPGAMLWWQTAHVDVTATGGASLSNAVKFTTP